MKLFYKSFATYLLVAAYSLAHADTPAAIELYNHDKFKEAYKEFLIQANAGDAEAQYYVGLMFEQGEGIAKDTDKAIHWFETASNNGFHEASYTLGEMYEYFNRGVQQDINEAVRWFKIAAEKGNIKAADKLGFIYRNGRGKIVKDQSASVKWYSLAAELWDNLEEPIDEIWISSDNSYHSAANVYSEAGDISNAVKAYVKAAERGNSQAMTTLGVIYILGEEVTRNYETAVSWLVRSYETEYRDNLDYAREYESEYGPPLNNGGVSYDDSQSLRFAAGDDKGTRREDGALVFRSQRVLGTGDQDDKDDPEIQNNLGNMYSGAGIGTDLDFDKALEWYLKAANQGFVKSYHNLGKLYDEGKGIGTNYEEAIKWYKLASDNGHAPSQNNLGVMIVNGRGTKQNFAEALKLFKSAAEANEYDAEVNLGIMYGKGLGIQQDFEKSAHWFREALSFRFPSKNPPVKTIPAGAYNFTHFVKLKDDVNEVEATKGVIYLSDEYFSDDEWLKIENSKKVRNSSSDLIGFPLEQNICIATLPADGSILDDKPFVQASRYNSVAAYVRAKTERSGSSEGVLNITLASWGHAAYGIIIELKDDVLEMRGWGGERGFGYVSERYEIEVVEDGSLDTCIDFALQVTREN